MVNPRAYEMVENLIFRGKNKNRSNNNSVSNENMDQKLLVCVEYIHVMQHSLSKLIDKQDMQNCLFEPFTII